MEIKLVCMRFNKTGITATITSCNNLTGKCTCTKLDWVVLKVEIERPVHASLAST
jgi:hypothetical protein